MKRGKFEGKPEMIFVYGLIALIVEGGFGLALWFFVF